MQTSDYYYYCATTWDVIFFFFLIITETLYCASLWFHCQALIWLVWSFEEAVEILETREPLRCCENASDLRCLLATLLCYIDIFSSISCSSRGDCGMSVLELAHGLLTVQLVAAADLVITLLNECSKNIPLNLDTFCLPGGADSRFYLGSAYWNPLFQ